MILTVFHLACVNSGEGLYEGLDWLHANTKDNKHFARLDKAENSLWNIKKKI